MGCRITKNDSSSPSPNQSTEETPTMSRHVDPAIDYKSRLERKMCLAKETPEPDFDLANCMVKEIPSGVFILCRVLRKETLNLSSNKLHSLKGGGFIGDLVLLRTLDLSQNRFKKLPDDFCKLTNLRELMISHNLIEHLPDTINKLTNLELLDVSHNKLVQINQINCMPHLRILNIRGNDKIAVLPNELSTCDSLVDLILDPNTIQYPPIDVLERGTMDILNFLITGEMPQGPIEHNRDAVTSVEYVKTQVDGTYEQAYRDKMLEEDRLALEKNVLLEAELYNQHEKKKQEFLHQLLQQQTENDNLVTKIQHKKDLERNRLINDILEDEKDSNILVEKLLCLRNGPDPALLERERLEQEELLANLSIQHSDLRKQEILSAMSDILGDEAKTLQYYQEQKDASAKEYLQRETETNSLLARIFENNDKDRTAAVVQIMQDEELQKSAVASLITKNDSRTWGLIEQVRIVENQLAALTHYEIERRKLCVDETISTLSEQRLNLTFLLLDLLQQQEQRKQQLLDTLVGLESQNENEQPDFWLLQYQKLWDSQPIELSTKTATIDPLLGYQFLLNGVVHCLPFLSKIWQNMDLNQIADDDLRTAGISNPADRLNILLSIQQYTSQSKQTEIMVAAPSTEKDSSIDRQPATAPPGESISTDEKSLETLSECVVCMEESCKIIFLPCGHLCCCLNCHTTLELCPMCRTQIERRIKVIQP